MSRIRIHRTFVPVTEGKTKRAGTRSLGRALLVALAALALPGAALAQAFPSKPIRLVLPYAASGLPDVLARLIAQKMSVTVAQQVIVENKPGASGIIAAQFVANSAPDGHTLFLIDSATHGINPAVFSKLPYDPLRDFTPVIQAVRGPMFLVVNADVKANTVKELVALAKANPGMNYGSPGNASIHHLGMEQLKHMGGVDMTHVPYKGVVQATPALLSNEVPVMFAALTSVIQHAKSGKLRILAVGAAQRSSLMPDVPGMDESGYPGVESATNMGFAAPAGTPAAVIERLNSEMVAALKSPDVAAKMPALGVELVASTPAYFGQMMRRDRDHYMKLVKQVGLKVE